MSVSLVITFTGPDRPGIVDRLARTVAEHGGNWEESRSASLVGRFAGILQVTAPDSSADDLIDALRGFEKDGLRVLVERGEPEERPAARRLLRLELTGADHEGIVRDVAHSLAKHGVNIEDLVTEHTSAPMSGHVLFRAVALLDCPPEVAAEDLERELEQLADDLVVEIDIHEATPD